MSNPELKTNLLKLVEPITLAKAGAYVNTFEKAKATSSSMNAPSDAARPTYYNNLEEAPQEEEELPQAEEEVRTMHLEHHGPKEQFIVMLIINPTILLLNAGVRRGWCVPTAPISQKERVILTSYPVYVL